MDIKWRKFSCSIITKILAFAIAIVCFTGMLTIFFNVGISTEGNFDVLFEKSFFQSSEFMRISNDVLSDLNDLVRRYKSEDHILSGGTLNEDNIRYREERLFEEFQYNSKSYNPKLSREEKYQIFKEVYADRIAQIRDDLIQEELRAYNHTLMRMEEHHDLVYFAKAGENEFTNMPNNPHTPNTFTAPNAPNTPGNDPGNDPGNVPGTEKEYFKSFPAYMIFSGTEQEVFPGEIKENPYYYWLNPTIGRLRSQGGDMLCLGFSEEFLNSRMEKWADAKNLVEYGAQQLAVLSLGLIAAFIFLVWVIGKRPEGEQGLQLNVFDRIYNDIKIILCLAIIGLWFAFGSIAHRYNSVAYFASVTLVMAIPGLILILSLVKHLKNGTFIKHSLTYVIFAKIFGFVKDTYDSGSVAIKVVIIVIAYPLLVAATFFMFPITIGVAAWFALKKAKNFNALKEGVKKVKEGDLRYAIKIPGNGEFARLAADINSIADGLKKAVENEIKSERLKNELITNVSHDIRTPLTSIITYIDLLKTEEDENRRKEYMEILEQKSQRLKILTDDLFEASKANSGNMPVNLEKIDLVSLLTQGLGELDDKIRERRLEFRVNHPREKVFITADGKLFWRSIENLLSNIFKYALEGSRVYVDITETGTTVTLTIKNISAYELNISADELMERFKRGDESRSSQGSGLGLSIAKSLIEIQRGSFKIEIDGDLFKAIIQMPKSAE